MKRGHRLRHKPRHILHSSLQRSSEDSAYRSVCPLCKVGLLMVGRNQETLALVRLDRCTYCAQHFFYDDETIGDEPVEALPPDYEKTVEAQIKALSPQLVKDLGN